MAIIDSILDIGSTLIKNLFPNKLEQQAAQLKLLEMQQNGELKELEMRMNAIVAEAKSEDKWTSRSRPTFLYVIYIMILMAFPMGLISYYNPSLAHTMMKSIAEWFNAIPKIIWELFGAGYLGYVFSRSYDKKQILNAKK